MSDPFSLVYEALWTLAEASVPLTNLVRLKNRIKLDEDRRSAGLKDEIQTADLPELVLAITTASGNIRATSSSSMITRQYQWQISTGDIRPGALLLPLEWALWCAMADWCHPTTGLSRLTWEDQTFVKRAQLVTCEAGESDPERNRGIRGWSALWALEVEMHFRTSDLANYNIYGTGTGS